MFCNQMTRRLQYPTLTQLHRDFKVSMLNIKKIACFKMAFIHKHYVDTNGIKNRFTLIAKFL